jgi:hypothetical protein
MLPSGTVVDPAVSRRKFDREVTAFRAREEEYRGRGWWLQKAAFPIAMVAFAAPQLRPAPLVFGARLDFTNYDLWAPSVQVVDPFTHVPYTMAELPSKFARKTQAPEGLTAPGPEEVSFLMQAWAPNEIPFLCLPGVREYHENPGHTGDPWLLHRKGGEGTLFFILDQLHRYGIAPINGHAFNLNIVMTGFTVGGVPR